MHAIEYKPEALRVLRRLPPGLASRIRAKIQALAMDPHAINNNVKALVGTPAFRLRVGDWRVVYLLDNDKLLVVVLRVRPRGSAYDDA